MMTRSQKPNTNQAVERIGFRRIPPVLLLKLLASG